MKLVNNYITKAFNDNCFYNESIFETANFKVIPSLGSLVEGWLLIIPKEHYISMGQIDNELLYDELNLLIDYVSLIITKEYGDFVIFEHGAIRIESKVGCGVDYAHLHIVPTNLKLNTLASEYLKNFIWESVPSIASSKYYFKKNLPYLYYKSLDNSYLGTSTNIPSQLFRKIIANHLHTDEKYDWKEHYFLDVITQTIEKLSKYSSNIIYGKELVYE